MDLSDTDPAIERMRTDAFRRMSASDKLRLVAAWTRSLITLARADVRSAHPDASEREIELLLVSRWLPPDLLFRAFGWRAPETQKRDVTPL